MESGLVLQLQSRTRTIAREAGTEIDRDTQADREKQGDPSRQRDTWRERDYGIWPCPTVTE